MRGIINYVRGFIHHTREQGLGFAAYMVREDWHDWTNKHFAYFHQGWTPRGLFVLLPGTTLSFMLEWHGESRGWSSERREGCLEVWFGRLQGTFCRDEVVSNPDLAIF